MEKYTIEIKQCDKLRELDKLQSLVDDFKVSIGRFRVSRGTEREVLNKLSDFISTKESETDKEYQRVLDFFSDKLKRYWKMCVRKTICGVEYTENKLIYPYSIREDNGYIACVQTNDVSDVRCYAFTFDDNGFTVEQLCNSNGDCVVDLEEITKDEFLNSVDGVVHKILDYRLNKNSKNETSE